MYLNVLHSHKKLNCLYTNVQYYISMLDYQRISEIELGVIAILQIFFGQDIDLNFVDTLRDICNILLRKGFYSCQQIERLKEEKESLASQSVRPAAEGQENGDVHAEQSPAPETAHLESL